MSRQTVENAVKRWLDTVVIGLGLCPFAKPVVAAGKLEIIVSEACDADSLFSDLERALSLLTDDGPDTIVVAIANWLSDFADYNDFLDVAEALIEAKALVGVIQIASFHPDYRFADEPVDAISHYTNRAPFPLLHLLRESDVEQAIAQHPDAESISARNIAKLESLTDEDRRRLFNRALSNESA
ncbi:MAG: DUF1415 domain-containing protein [Pseudomonadota bacterium]